MKKKILFRLLILISSITIAENYYEFFLRQTPEEQVKVIIDEFKNHTRWGMNIKFAAWMDIIVENEDFPTEILIKKLEIYQKDFSSDSIDILIEILLQKKNRTTNWKNEYNEQISLILKKIFQNYVCEKKVIDLTGIIYLYYSDLFSKEQTINSKEDCIKMQSYFKNMGITDVIIDWESIEKLYSFE